MERPVLEPAVVWKGPLIDLWVNPFLFCPDIDFIPVFFSDLGPTSGIWGEGKDGDRMREKERERDGESMKASLF